MLFLTHFLHRLIIPGAEGAEVAAPGQLQDPRCGRGMPVVCMCGVELLLWPRQVLMMKTTPTPDDVDNMTSAMPLQCRPSR
jgi:hypothetical protein